MKLNPVLNVQSKDDKLVIGFSGEPKPFAVLGKNDNNNHDYSTLITSISKLKGVDNPYIMDNWKFSIVKKILKDIKSEPLEQRIQFTNTFFNHDLRRIDITEIKCFSKDDIYNDILIYYHNVTELKEIYDFLSIIDFNNVLFIKCDETVSIGPLVHNSNVFCPKCVLNTLEKFQKKNLYILEKNLNEAYLSKKIFEFFLGKETDNFFKDGQILTISDDELSISYRVPLQSLHCDNESIFD